MKNLSKYNTVKRNIVSKVSLPNNNTKTKSISLNCNVIWKTIKSNEELPMVVRKMRFKHSLADLIKNDMEDNFLKELTKQNEKINLCVKENLSIQFSNIIRTAHMAALLGKSKYLNYINEFIQNNHLINTMVENQNIVFYNYIATDNIDLILEKYTKKDMLKRGVNLVNYLVNGHHANVFDFLWDDISFKKTVLESVPLENFIGGGYDYDLSTEKSEIILSLVLESIDINKINVSETYRSFHKMNRDWNILSDVSDDKMEENILKHFNRFIYLVLKHTSYEFKSDDLCLLDRENFEILHKKVLLTKLDSGLVLKNNNMVMKI